MVLRERVETHKNEIRALALSQMFFEADAVRWPDLRWKTAWNGFIEDKTAQPKLPATKCFSNSRCKSYYRFNSSPVLDDRLLLPGFQSGAISQLIQNEPREILIISDTSTMNFNTSKEQPSRHGLCRFSVNRQGFLSHMSIALSAEAPFISLGLVDVFNFVHSSKLDHDFARQFWLQRGGILDNEQSRWVDRICVVEKMLKPVEVSPIYVNDREGDCYADLCAHIAARRRFIIRASQLSRSVRDEQEPEICLKISSLIDKMSKGTPLGTRVLEVSERAQAETHKCNHPKRKARQARFEIQSRKVCISRPTKESRNLPEEINVTLVLAKEVDVPEGEQAMQWVLLTDQEVTTAQDAFKVLDRYGARWKIEELFKALKTGTGFEQRQLESVEGLLKELMMSLVIAMGLLGLRDWSRNKPQAPARMVLNETQLEVLQALVPHQNWSRPSTCLEAMTAVALLGGWVKRKSQPGWIVLGRGYAELTQAVRIWCLARGRPEKDVGNS
jgi:hypothetical protein